MGKRIGKFLETARDNIFLFLVYTTVVTAIALMGFQIIKFAPPIGKMMGLLVVIGAVYLEFYFPTWINKRKFNN